MDIEYLMQLLSNPAGAVGSKIAGGVTDRLSRELEDTPFGRFGEDVGYAAGEAKRFAGGAIRDLRDAITPDVLVDYLTHLDTGLPTKALSALRSKGGPGSFTERQATRRDPGQMMEAPSEPEDEIDLSDPAVLAAVTSGKRRVGKNSKVKNSGGTFSRTGGGFKSPTNPEMLKLMYNAAIEKEKSRNSLQGQKLRAYAAAGLPANELMSVGGDMPQLERILKMLEEKGYKVTPPS